MAESAAMDAGLLQNDLIAAINGTSVTTIQEVLTAIEPYEPGTTVTVDYIRNGQAAQVSATLKACANVAPNVNVFEHEIEIDGDSDHQDQRVIIIKKKKCESPKDAVTSDEEGSEEGTVTENVWIDQAGAQTLQLETLDIFPNPTDSKLTVQFKAPAGPLNVRIVDLNGKEIVNDERNDFNGDYQETFDLSNQAKGTFILMITQDGQVFTEKIILQ